jgi:hypothetical protein
MCDRCNGTGLTRERREGVDYPSVCRACDRYDAADHTRADLYRLADQTDREIPITAVC